MICSEGHTNPDGQKFCGQCGQPLTGSAASLPPEPRSGTGGPAADDPGSFAFDLADVVPTADSEGDLTDDEIPPSSKPLVPLLAVVAAAAILAVGWFAWSSLSGSPRVIRGTFTLVDFAGIDGTWSSCSGEGGYSDFGPGMSVSVYNGSGELIGTGQTRSARSNLAEIAFVNRQGRSWDTPEDAPAEVVEETREDLETLDSSMCTVYFETGELPKEAFYRIEVGRRGDLSYSLEDLESSGFTVALTLGG